MLGLMVGCGCLVWIWVQCVSSLKIEVKAECEGWSEEGVNQWEVKYLLCCLPGRSRLWDLRTCHSRADNITKVNAQAQVCINFLCELRTSS